MSIAKGKKTAILGPNGAGKTTLFLHFNGILRPKRGKIFYDGKEVCYRRAEIAELRKNVGIVFQNPDVQLFLADLYQEISFGPINLGYSEDEVKEKVESAMRCTGILELRDKPVHHLSYGQKKSVSIADVLAMEPEVVILDEPTAYLDPRHVSQITAIFDVLVSEGKTVILSTHDLDFAYSWADYIYVMDKGKIVAKGDPVTVFSSAGRDPDLFRMPLILEVYSILRENGIACDAAVPRNAKELKKYIKLALGLKC